MKYVFLAAVINSFCSIILVLVRIHDVTNSISYLDFFRNIHHVPHFSLYDFCIASVFKNVEFVICWCNFYMWCYQVSLQHIAINSTQIFFIKLARVWMICSLLKIYLWLGDERNQYMLGSFVFKMEIACAINKNTWYVWSIDFYFLKDK